MFKNINCGETMLGFDRRQTGEVGGHSMPYTPEHKAQTRERIVESARRLFSAVAAHTTARSSRSSARRSGCAARNASIVSRVVPAG